MPQRFRDTVKEQSNTNSCAEKHSEVGHVRKLRLGVFVSEFNVAVAVCKPKDEERHDRVTNDVEPGEILDGLCEPLVERYFRFIRFDHAVDGNAPEKRQTEKRDEPVETKFSPAAERDDSLAHREISFLFGGTWLYDRVIVQRLSYFSIHFGSLLFLDEHRHFRCWILYHGGDSLALRIFGHGVFDRLKIVLNPSFYQLGDWVKMLL
mmetsp:Transcript_22065/g.45284  ORF Transcript_22065/g.45284 Transcript_22065/m.45284 type:complete len:207 (+) Transcript_22065:1533-2153(+)